MIPDSNFPDTRNGAAVHSTNGSCMLVPREDDKIRLYIQLPDQDVLDPETGRIDKTRMDPAGILKVRISSETNMIIDVVVVKVAEKTLYPFYIRPLTGIEWWTIYTSTFPEVVLVLFSYLPCLSRSASSIFVFSWGSCIHCR